jgi:hypothetical protein
MYNVWLKSKLFLLLSIIAPLLTQGQATYFNTIRIPGDNHLDLLENDTAYVVFQQGNPQVNELHLHYFNKAGSFTKSDTFKLDTFYESSQRGLVPWKKGYLKLGSYFFDNMRGESVLLAFDENLDSLSSTRLSYSDPLFSHSIAYGLKAFSANEILVYGNYFTWSGNFNLWLTRLDSNLQVKWDTIYNRLNWTGAGGWQAYDIVKLGDGGYIIGGIATRFLNQKNAGVLLKTDSLGQEEWRLELSGPEGNNEVLLQKLSDSTVAFVTARIDSLSVSSTSFTRIRYGVVSASGTISLDTLLGPRVLNMQTSFFKTTPEGNFITGGYAQSLNWGSYAFKFSPQGDSLWFRQYFNGTDFFSDQAVLESLIFTQDGGMLFGGYFLDRNGLGAHTWLVKTDSFGCLVPGCQNIGLREASAGKPTNFKVYPNPAGARVTVTWNWFEAGLTAPLKFKILSPQGQLLNNYRVENYQNNQQVLNLEALAAGTYLLEISTQEKILDVQRLVKK